MRRLLPARTLSLVAVLIVGALFVEPAGADGVTDQQQQVKDDLAEINRLQQKAAELNEEYLGYVAEIADLDAQITAGQQEIATHQAELAALETQLTSLAVQQFTGGSGNGIATLFGGTEAVTDGLQRAQLLGVAVNAGAVTTDDYDELLDLLDNEQSTLENKQAKATSLADQASKASKRTVQAGLDYQEELKRDQAELGNLLAEEQQRQLDEAAAAHAADLAAIEANEKAANEAAAAAADAATTTTAKANTPTTGPASTGSATTAAPGNGSNAATPPSTTSPDSGSSGNGPDATSPHTDPPAATDAPANDSANDSNDDSSGNDSGGDSGDSSDGDATVVIDTSPPAASSLAAVAVDAARSQLGVPYRYATSLPGVSFDCSGLTSYAWRVAGVSIPHQSAQQYASTPHVALADIQPGDLLYYYHPISHVAIYIGNGQVIQAPAPGKVVEVASINWANIVGASRPG